MAARHLLKLACPAVVCLGIFFSLAASSRAADLSGLHWRSIGPAVSGGRVAAVAGANTNPFLYYIGAAGGGVYRTTNGGATWDDVFAKLPVASIGSISIAPSNSNVVWVGTGESKPRNDVSAGDGIWQSLDGGRSWNPRGLDSSFSIARILIDPHNSNVVVAGVLGDPYKDSTERGVYRTTDGGRTWHNTLFVSPSSGVSDLACDARGRVVFAGIWHIRREPWTFTSGGQDDGLYRSKDGGVNWERLSGNGLPSGLMGRIGVAVAPSNPRRVYALIQSKAGALWRSDDGGDHWRFMTGDTKVNQRPFYMSRLEIDPTNADHAYFLSEDIYETKDGGKTFNFVPAAVHQDHHAMWIAADGKRMIEGDDGGAPISLDGGKTWDERYNVSVGQVYHVGYDLQNPYHICGGFQDNDSYCGPSNSLSPLGILNEDWHDAGSDGDGSWTWPDPRDPKLVWNVNVRDVNGQLSVYDYKSRQSYDVTPYARDTTGAPLAGLPYRFNWEAPVAFSRHDPSAVYFGGNVMWLSRDRGRTWKQISPDLTLNDPSHQQVAGGPINTDVSGAEFYDTILDIAPSPVDARVIWAGTDDGLIQVTRDSGAHWTNVSVPSILPYGRIDNIDASVYNAGTAFAVVDRHLSGDYKPYIFETTNYGATWQLRSGDLPQDNFARVVRQDPRNPNVLYAGFERGVEVSFDRGQHWQSLQLNMGTVAVRDLRIQPQADDLVLATHGRGFQVLDDLAPLQDLSAAQQAGTYFFQPRTAYDFFYWWRAEYGVQSNECCATQNSFVGENPPAGALLSFYLSSPARQKPQCTITDGAGHIVARLTAPNKSGINRFAWSLTEDPPESWLSAPDWNKGPSTGPEVVPGIYRAELRIDGQTLVRRVLVKPDPRGSWSQSQYQQRHDFLKSLYSELGAIDHALNTLDRMRPRLHSQLRAEANSVAQMLSSNPRNSEDDQWRPDKLRERLQTLIDFYAHEAQGPPLPPHYAEAARIKTEFDADMALYNKFIAHARAAGQS